jgi:hypothetical protein
MVAAENYGKALIRAGICASSQELGKYSIEVNRIFHPFFCGSEFYPSFWVRSKGSGELSLISCSRF